MAKTFEDAKKEMKRFEKVIKQMRKDTNTKSGGKK